MISLIACFISYSMFSFTFKYMYCTYVLYMTNVSQAGGVEAFVRLQPPPLSCFNDFAWSQDPDYVGYQ